jgi:hypothetical protein
MVPFMVSYPTPYSTKSLPYPIYNMGTYPNANVCIFGKAIHANGENNDVDIVNLFCLHFMMKYLSGERIY